ncbi:MAG TPA: ABC transporter permease subunit, partial [Gemmatimonadaceae bacterium]
GLLRFTGEDVKTLLSLSNIVIFVVPLMTLVYGTVYLYNSREFIELLLAQPIRRKTVFGGLYLGLAIPLTAAFAAGVSLPFILSGIDPAVRAALVIMVAGGAALTLIFTGIAFCVALKFEDKLTGLGAVLGIWLLLALVYDGALLLIVALFSDHSLEKSLLAATLFNPIDLVRIALLLQFDVSALMGYTGAVFSRFFSGAAGVSVIAAALTLWIGGPLGYGLIAFNRKDL